MSVDSLKFSAATGSSYQDINSAYYLCELKYFPNSGKHQKTLQRIRFRDDKSYLFDIFFFFFCVTASIPTEQLYRYSVKLARISENNVSIRAHRTSWNLEIWSRRLDSENLDAPTIDDWALNAWTLDNWTLG